MPGPDTLLHSAGRDATGHDATGREATGREANGPSNRVLLIAGAVVVVLLGGTLALWAHVGTALFFETIRAGFMACFG